MIVGVSLFAIVYHAILNKLESEKRMKFVTERLRVVLENNSVKTTQENLALIFDRYIKQVPDTDKKEERTKSMDEFSKKITEKQIVNVVPKTMAGFSHALVTK